MRFFPPSYPKAGVIPSSSSVVGGIKIQYPAHPYNLVLTFQIILLITSLIHYFSGWRNSQRNLQIKLPISFLVKPHYILPLYLFWKARSGTCWIIVYTLLLVSLFELENVLYIVRKVFSVWFQRIRDCANWIVGS